MITNQATIETFTNDLKTKTLSEALGFTPSNLDQIAAFAAALYQDGKLEASLKLLEGLINLCPEKSEYWSAFGAVLTRLGRHEQAIPILTVAIKMDSKDTAAWVNRGECYIAMAENEKAAADLQLAIDLDPHQQDQASNRARQIVLAMTTFFQECINEGLDEVEVLDERH